MVDNELFVVTVGTFPVAVYRVTGLQDSVTRADEDAERHHYAGTLLARVTAGMVARPCRPVSGYLQAATTQIMRSRIAVDSGGPIGYLMPR